MQALKNKLSGKAKALKSEAYEVLAVLLIASAILLYMKVGNIKNESRKPRRSI